MRRWLWMTGGLVVWVVHFNGVYAISSLADVIDRADAFVWRMAAMGFSVLCLAACAALLVQALRTPRRDDALDMGRDLAALSAGVGAVAILWQAAPTVIGY